jgi:hypothetical protein
MNPAWNEFGPALADMLAARNNEEQEEDDDVFDELMLDALLIRGQTAEVEELSEPAVRPGPSKRVRVRSPVVEEDDEMVENAFSALRFETSSSSRATAQELPAPYRETRPRKTRSAIDSDGLYDISAVKGYDETLCTLRDRPAIPKRAQFDDLRQSWARAEDRGQIRKRR